MKRTLFLVAALLLMVGCHSQEKKEQTKGTKDNISQEQPKGSWEVNREYDENGNLIAYDSIYSWSSSDLGQEMAKMDKDSLLQNFRMQFSKEFSPLDDEQFNNFFSNDSLFTKRFFQDDFFESPIGKDFMDLNEIHEHMQEMQKKFLENYGSESKKPENKQS
ncbi:hypothetical protein [Flagellimonas lutimaris]|uniref:hypothetical protein n=1 Tax=Flagellimonas lutimaris TaxID=475082 RepID=UPI003F5CE605